MTEQLEPRRNDLERRYVNDEVVARYPAGTDPRKAIREVLAVGLERTDGGTDLPWWLDTVWWHGGRDGIRVLTDLVAPSISGIVPHTTGSDPNSVYITRNRDDALLYACWHRSPMLYEVSTVNVPIFDDTLDDPDSFRVPRATVRKAHRVTEAEVRAVLNIVFGELD